MPTQVFETFGSWLRYHRNALRYSLRDIAELTDVSHTTISKLEGDPSGPESISPRPKIEFITRISSILNADLNEGKRLAGYPKELDASEPPENWEDWPLDLRQALMMVKNLTPEVQSFMYKLWKEQAKAHYDIEERRKEAERQLDERERRLQQAGN